MQEVRIFVFRGGPFRELHETLAERREWRVGGEGCVVEYKRARKGE